MAIQTINNLIVRQKNEWPIYKLNAIDSLAKAKNAPCVFNNWAVCYNGKFETLHLLNESYLKKLIGL